jgi:catechol 2,3-dioxygenase-like lactoylglutathione lyase family enzyme
MGAIESIVETSAYVDDLGRAERFYGDVLGLELLAREEGRHAFFRVGDRNVLLLFHAPTTLKGDRLPAHGATGPGHFAFGVSAESLGDWRERLEKHDVPVEQEVTWPRGARSLYFRDPSGNSVELVTPGLWGLSSGW